MFQNLGIFKVANAMAAHAGASQTVITQNVANADTPGYRAREVTPFQKTLNGPATLEQQVSRTGHLRNPDQSATSHSIRYSDAEPSPNGNSVSIEEEMLKAVEVSRNHTRALAIYRHGLTILRSTLGR